MNAPSLPGDRPPDRAVADDALAELLRVVERRFYPGTDAANRSHFYRDRRRLIYALSWPAVWLERRGLTCSPARYRHLLTERLDAIARHGDPQRYGAYFPTYLLKCLQDWFQHHGDELYSELKHIRNALDHVLASVTFAARVRRDAQQIDMLAAAHRLLQPHSPRPRKTTAAQLTLF